MHPHKKQKLTWMAYGVLVGVILACVAACCCWRSPSVVLPPAECGDGSAGVVDVPPLYPDGECDAGVVIDVDALPAFDAGPSCGSHPWCPHPKECCSNAADCCA